MVDFTNIKSIEIPEGTVKKIEIGGVILWQSGSSPTPRLPAEYQEVEWIKTSSYRRMSTDIKGDLNTEVRGEITKDATTSNTGLFGYKDTSGKGFSYNGTSTSYCGNKSGTAKTLDYVTKGAKFSFKQNKDGIFINNTKVLTFDTTTSFTTPASLSLFTSGSNTGYDKVWDGKIYWFQIYKNDELVRDYVPCYRKLDDVIGMYDLVEETFNEGIGNGTFSKGQDV